MNILAVMGSYRKGRTIDSAVSAILEGAKAKGAETKKIHLLDEHIEFCTNCRRCMQEKVEAGRSKCIHEDDMDDILTQIDNADAIVLESPINLGTVTAIMKRFIERLGPYFYWPWGEAVAPVHRIVKPDKKATIPVVIVGLDSASFDVIDPWLEAGELPNLQKLIAEGVSGKLRSTIHPMSGPAWASFMTGKNPGKHGIFDWTRHVDGGYEASLVNSMSLCGRTLWQIASEAGFTTGVVNVPVTYPPQAVDGYLVSGLLTPSSKSDFVFPPHLADELHRAADGYVIHGQERRRRGRRRPVARRATRSRCPT